MSMVTQCPACGTSFRVTPPQLQAQHGMVRCGRCAQVFDGFETLATQRDALATHVLVTHDWNLALVREELLGITPERAWPDFLDGVVVSVDGDELLIEAHGRVGRLPRLR